MVNDLAVPPDTNPEPRKLVGAEGLDDVAQPVVAAGRPAATKPEPAQGQIGVIGNDQQIGFVLGVGVRKRRPQGRPRLVHEAGRLDEEHLANRIVADHLEAEAAPSRTWPWLTPQRSASRSMTRNPTL